MTYLHIISGPFSFHLNLSYSPFLSFLEFHTLPLHRVLPTLAVFSYIQPVVDAQMDILQLVTSQTLIALTSPGETQMCIVNILTFYMIDP